MEPNLFDDNIDIFADLTVKPKEKSKKKVEAKSVFDDDTGEYGSLAPPVSLAILSRASLPTDCISCGSPWLFLGLRFSVGFLFFAVESWLV